MGKEKQKKFKEWGKANGKIKSLLNLVQNALFHKITRGGGEWVKSAGTSIDPCY